MGAAVPGVGAVEIGAGETALFCIGAHMAGLPLNGQLRGFGGRFLREAVTEPVYRLLDLGNRPGMVRVASGGGAVVGEVWAVPTERIGGLLATVPAPLGFGRVRLSDGEALGFVCEAAVDAPDITASGGWRAHLAAREAA